ncbi:MAG TPA: CBS domain-containing protein, partial [Paracoccaceae bacterium]|nr:CBS domain-containing protein [Paracoccaceae bacterium]
MDTITRISDAFLEGRHEDVAACLAERHPADIASELEELDPGQAWSMLKLADRARQARVFGYFDHDFQTSLATVMPRTELAAVVMEMRADERADLYKELSDEQREALMPGLAHAEREDIRQLASYEEDTAGAIMTSSYASLQPELSATEALTVLRREAPDKETIYRAYVIDSDRKLLGSVRLQDLITAPARARVTDIMERTTQAIRVDDSAEEAARLIARYDVLALPVIDANDHLVGIITHDDALDVMEAEATEDFHLVGTVTGLDSSVATATIPMLYRARIMWLMVLVFGNIFSGAGIAHFEDTIAAHLAL